MPILDKLKNIFSKKLSAHRLSVSLCQNSVSYCYVKQDKSFECQSFPLVEGSYTKTLLTLSEELKLDAQATLLLPPKLSHNVQVDKPSVPASEITAALKWQIKDLVPIPPEDMILDYYDSPKLVGGVEKINVVCAPLSELSKLAPVLSKDDISLSHISIEEFAFANLIVNKEEACLLVCQQPNEEIVLLVVKKEQLFFTRRLRGYTHLSQKKQQDLEMGIVDALSIEIQRSTDYYERQLKQAPIKSIEVIVPIEQEAFLARKLSENTNVPVNLLVLPEGFEEHRQFAAVIGANNLIIDKTPERDATNASSTKEVANI